MLASKLQIVHEFTFETIAVMEGLVNMENFPGGMISGLSTDELNFFSTESNNRFLKELDSSFLNDIISFDDQYTSISDEIEKEMDTLEKKIAANLHN